MNQPQARQWAEHLFTEVWGKLNESLLSQYYHSDVVLQIGKQTAHFKDMVHRMQFVKSRYHFIKNTLNDVLVDGDKIVVRLTQVMGDTHKPSEIIVIYQLKDGKVSHAWMCADPAINYFEK